ncbi:SOS response-associated peptidase [Candidatus Woesebacteria bacterium]|nr:SOS response-associated peptidase [Candidatus Woesebacteria bacterium]
MCGRFDGAVNSDFKTYGLTGPPKGYQQSFNVAPGMLYPALFRESPLKAELMKWGLVPFWNKEPKVKFSTINARAETLGTSPVFREAYKKHRCLIPVRGFYEWRKNADGTKTPFFIHLKSRDTFAFAGIWDVWKDVEGVEFKSYAIITTTPNEKMAHIHTRMPVILSKADEDIWTDPIADVSVLQALLKPYGDDDMDMYRISSRVNSPANDDAEITKEERD